MSEQTQARRPVKTEPVVWMFQPNSFEVVTGDRLKEWERDMKREIFMRRGITIEIDITIVITSGTATYSFSGPSDSGPDDCDAD